MALKLGNMDDTPWQYHVLLLLGSSSQYPQCSGLTGMCLSLWLVIVKSVWLTTCLGGRIEDWLIWERKMLLGLCVQLWAGLKQEAWNTQAMWVAWNEWSAWAAFYAHKAHHLHHPTTIAQLGIWSFFFLLVWLHVVFFSRKLLVSRLRKLSQTQKNNLFLNFCLICATLCLRLRCGVITWHCFPVGLVIYSMS